MEASSLYRPLRRKWPLANRRHNSNSRCITPSSTRNPGSLHSICLLREDEQRMAALKARVSRDYPEAEADVRFIQGDSNTMVDQIIKALPKHSKQAKVLSFCFADPYKLKNLSFSTIERLSAQFMDFLILIPTGMDAVRNVSYYIRPQDKTIDEFIGTTEWRSEWQAQERQGVAFDRFLTFFTQEGWNNWAIVIAPRRRLN
jgi:three-Cys-motif partner protein